MPLDFALESEKKKDVEPNYTCTIEDNTSTGETTIIIVIVPILCSKMKAF